MLYAAVGVVVLPGSMALSLLEDWSHDPCPSLCDTSHNDPSNWTTYYDFDFLDRCQS